MWRPGICPLIPIFGHIYAALAFHDAYGAVQGLSLLTPARRSGKVSIEPEAIRRWGMLWMEVRF